MQINARANAFEAAIDSGRHYDAGKVVSVLEALLASGRAVDDAAALMAQVSDALRRSVGQTPPPA
ncbi:hypothetical protein D3C72_1758450 [compost metagenome]